MTATAMKSALIASNLAREVDIIRSPGAGGLIGLAQFVTSQQGIENSLIVGGKVMVGAMTTNRSAISLLDAIPIARLTTEPVAISVPQESPFKSIEDLLEVFYREPNLVSWIGGSSGGVDEQFLLELAAALDISPNDITYRAVPGGGEVAELLATGKYTAGISGHIEFQKMALQNKVRILASSASTDAANSPIPTLKKIGINIVTTNWRGVFAPPGISDQQLERLEAVVSTMASTQHWQELITQNHWSDAFLSGKQFKDFVLAEHQHQSNKQLQPKKALPSNTNSFSALLAQRYIVAIISVIAAGTLLFFLIRQGRLSKRKEEGLISDFETSLASLRKDKEKLEKALTGISASIAESFDKWKLTDAEREITILILKGLRLKDIADARGTSERTVRQQARSIYEKSGLNGRTDLSAYFLEDFFETSPVINAGSDASSVDKPN